MPTRWVSHNSTLHTAGDGTNPDTPIALDRANAIAQPGDLINLYTGTYASYDIAPARSGTSDTNRITYQSAPGHYATFDGGGTVTRKATLTDRWYITLRNMRFNTRGGASINAGLTNQTAPTANTAHHLILEDLTFDDLGTYVVLSPPPNFSANYNFAQLFMRGRNHIIRRCTFIKWKGTDCFQLWGEGHIVEDCDFGWNDTGHGSLICYAGRTIVRRNYFRNKWSRPGEMVGMSETDQLYYNAPDSMWEDNIFFDVGFAGLADGTQNEGYNAEGWGVENGQPIGDIQLMKWGGSGTIFRNNLWVGSNETPMNNNYDYACNIQMVAYDRSSGNQQKHRAMEHMRIYHNAFYDNRENGFYFNPPPASQEIPTADVLATDNRFLNNIIHAQAGHDFDFAGGTSQWFNTWQFHNNIFTSTFRDRGRGTIYSSFTAWANVWNRPSQATNNLTSAPTFRSPKYRPATSSENNSYPESNRNLKLQRDNYRLATSSVGRSNAAPLATVQDTYNSPTTTLLVSDVYPFHPNDHLANDTGQAPGDLIIVNGQTTRVMSKSRTNSTLTVSPAVIAPDNSSIWLARYGVSPDRGILPVTVDEEPPPAEENRILDPVQRGDTFASLNQARQTFTSGPVFPSSFALLVVAVAYRFYNPGNTPPAFNLEASTTIGDFALTRVAHQYRSASTNSGVALYVGQIGANAVQGTVTVGVESGEPTQWKMLIFELKGHKVSDPIRQTKAGGNIASELTLTFDQATLTDSMSIGAIYSREDADGVSPLYGFQEIDDSPATEIHLQAQWDIGVNTLVGWSGLQTTGGNVAVAIEVAAALANQHDFFASDLESGGPQLNATSLAMVFAMSPLDLDSPAPRLDLGPFSQNEVVASDALATGTPTLDQPVIGQVHNTVADALTMGAPSVGETSMIVVETGSLEPARLEAGGPEVESPQMGQDHKLYAAYVAA